MFHVKHDPPFRMESEPSLFHVKHRRRPDAGYSAAWGRLSGRLNPPVLPR